jgi:ribosome-binding factor A
VAGNRFVRVAEALKEEVGKILQWDLKDPRVKMATVTRVELTPDLRFARVFFSVWGDARDKEIALAGIESARGFIRRLVGHRIRLRYTPELTFKLDESSEYSIQIGKVIQKLKDGEEK